MFFLLSTGSIAHERASQDVPPWDSDFAMFYQSGRLILEGALDEVYRFIGHAPDTRDNLPRVWDDYLAQNGGWGTYYYAQTPWHAVGMIPLSSLPFRQAFAVANSLNILALLAASLVLGLQTKHRLTWYSVMLLAPIVLPIIAGYQWTDQPLRLQWSPIQETSKGISGNPLAGALWLAQPTPIITLLLTAYLIAAKNKSYAYAGLFAVLAVMKPSVFLALPLALLITEDWGKLVKWGAIWVIIFSVFFALIPGLGFPASFMKVASSYGSQFLPNLLQTHNWVWIYGSLIAAIALKFDAKGDSIPTK